MRNLTTIVTMSAASLVLLIGAACGQDQDEAGGEAPAAEDTSDEGQSQGADDEDGDEDGDDEGDDDEGDDEGDDDEGN